MRSNGMQAHKARTIGNRCMIQLSLLTIQDAPNATDLQR
jgi:hypothetical protein